MAMKLTNVVIVFFLVISLISVAENNGDATHMIEAPAPAPRPNPNTNFTMQGTTQGSLHPQECGPRCSVRCSRTQYKKPCLFFCQKCCAKCLCVPPGFYGNKQVCPCYNNWKTKRGGPKCP